MHNVSLARLDILILWRRSSALERGRTRDSIICAASPGCAEQIDFPIGGLVSGCRPVIGWSQDCGAVIGGAFSGQAGYSITRHSQGDSGLTIGVRNTEYRQCTIIRGLPSYYSLFFSSSFDLKSSNIVRSQYGCCVGWCPGCLMFYCLIQFVCFTLM